MFWCFKWTNLIQKLLMHHNIWFLLWHKMGFLKSKLIWRDDSPYNSPVWPVQKPEGRWHWRADYQHQNASTTLLTAAVPDIKTATLQAVAHPCMAGLEAIDTFIMIPLKEEDRNLLPLGREYNIPLTGFHRYKHSPTIAYAALAELYRQSHSHKVWNFTNI